MLRSVMWYTKDTEESNNSSDMTVTVCYRHKVATEPVFSSFTSVLRFVAGDKGINVSADCFRGKIQQQTSGALTWKTLARLYIALQTEAGSGLLAVISMQHMTCIYL